MGDEPCDFCGDKRSEHPGDGACTVIIRPSWADDDECWCDRYMPAAAATVDHDRRIGSP